MSLPGRSHSDSFIVFGVIVLIKLAQIVTANINYNAIRHDEPFGLDPEQARTTRQMLEAFDNWAIIRPNYTLQQATEHLLQYGALLRIQILDTFGSLVYDHYDDYSIRQTEALYRVYQETLERKYNIFDIVPSVLNTPDTRPTKICRYIYKNVHTCLKESSMTCLSIKEHDDPHPDTTLSPVVNITRGMYKNAEIRLSYPGGFSLPAVLRHLKAGRLELTVDLLSGLLHNVQYDSFDDEVRTAERNAMIALKSDKLRNLVPKDIVNRVHTVSELLKELFDIWKTTHDRDTNKSFAVLSEHVVREVEAISRNIEALGTVYENNSIDVNYLFNLVLPTDVVDRDITEAKDYLLAKIADYDIVRKYLKVEKYLQSGPDQLLMEILGQMRDVNFAVDLATALHAHARFWHQSRMVNNLNELLELFDAYENLRNVPEYARLMLLMDKIRVSLWDSKIVNVEILCNNPRACLHIGLEIVVLCASLDSETKHNVEELFSSLTKTGSIYVEECKMPVTVPTTVEVPQVTGEWQDELRLTTTTEQQTTYRSTEVQTTTTEFFVEETTGAISTTPDIERGVDATDETTVESTTTTETQNVWQSTEDSTTKETTESTTTEMAIETLADSTTTEMATETLADSTTTEIAIETSTDSTTEMAIEISTDPTTTKMATDTSTESTTTEMATEALPESTTTETATEALTESTTTEMAIEPLTESTTTEMAVESLTDATTTEMATETSTESTTEMVIEIETSTDSTTTEMAAESLTNSTTTELATEILTGSTTTEMAIETSTDSTTTEMAAESSTESIRTEIATETSKDSATTKMATETSTDLATTEMATETSTDPTTTEIAVETSTDSTTTEIAVESLLESSTESPVEAEIAISSESTTTENTPVAVTTLESITETQTFEIPSSSELPTESTTTFTIQEPTTTAETTTVSATTKRYKEELTTGLEPKAETYHDECGEDCSESTESFTTLRSTTRNTTPTSLPSTMPDAETTNSPFTVTTSQAGFDDSVTTSTEGEILTKSSETKRTPMEENIRMASDPPGLTTGSLVKDCSADNCTLKIKTCEENGTCSSSDEAQTSDNCAGDDCQTNEPLNSECVGDACTESPPTSTTISDCIGGNCSNDSRNDESTCTGDDCLRNDENRISTTTVKPESRCDNKDPHHQRKLHRLRKIRLLNALHATTPVPQINASDSSADDDFFEDSQSKSLRTTAVEPPLLHAGVQLQHPHNNVPDKVVPRKSLSKKSIRGKKMGKFDSGRKRNNWRNVNVNRNININTMNMRRFLSQNSPDASMTTPPPLKLVDQFNHHRQQVETRNTENYDESKRRMSTSGRWNYAAQQGQSDDKIERVRRNRSIIRAPKKANRRYRAL